MEFPPRQIFSILTGDVVGSSQMHEPDRRLLQGTLTETLGWVQSVFEEPLSGAVFRGDSWQFLVTAPMKAFEIAMLIRTHLRESGIDSRVAVGIGQIDFIPDARVEDGDGAAFHLSGRGLDEMSRGRRMAVAIQGTDSPMLRTVCGLVDAISSDWTKSQCQAIVSAMLGWNQSETADGWQPQPITQQAVAQHLQSAKWTVISDALESSASEIELQVAQLQKLVK